MACDVAGSHGGFFEEEDAAAFEDTVKNGFGEAVVVEQVAPIRERLVVSTRQWIGGGGCAR